MLKNELQNITENDIFPYIKDERYRNLLLRFMHTKVNNTNEFIISEAIQIYADTDDDNIRLRVLELLKDVNS